MGWKIQQFSPPPHFGYTTDARKDPRDDYWKISMNGQPMPKAITDLFDQNSDSMNLDRFVRNFGTKPNVIIYHSHDHHVHSEESKPSTVDD
ncbi:hypothetical protein DH2020_006764 [Rehmannia glutinosa]|uniref:Uncharacterized protein n=1 Tax=Rehmannia glutinosa TaxID=99300 RepID=A0ABR0XJT6_REHGL